MPTFAALAEGRIDRDAYIRLLGRLVGFHEPMECAISQALESAPFARDLRGWRRADLLHEDLAFMGLDAVAIARFPRLRAFPAKLSAIGALGWLYVLEGSTLGGRQLARRLGHILSENTATGRLFLLAGGDRDHIAWREVCAVIDHVGVNPAGQDTLVSAALEAFDCFEMWFSDSRAVDAT